MPITAKYHFLSDLISTLEADGFVIGTGKHLQLQELLSKLPENLPLESLKTILCPIIATNRQDQARFYELFENSLQRVQEWEKPTETITTKRPKDVELWRNIVVILFVFLAAWAGYILDWNIFKWWGNPTFLLILALAGGGIYFVIQAFPKWWQRVFYVLALITIVVFGQLLKREVLPDIQATTEYIPIKIEPGSTSTLAIPLEKDSLLNVTLCGGSTTDTSATFGSLFVDSIGNLTLVAKDSFDQSIRHYICVLAQYRTIIDTTYFVVQYDPPAEPSVETTAEKATLAQLDTMAIPFPRDITELQIDPDQQKKAEFYRKNAWWLKLLIIGLFGAILWSIAQWRERKRRRLVAQLEQRDKPPYIWNIQSEQAEGLIFSDSARIVLNQLRRRRLDDAYKLDIGKTVEATVRSAGRVDFQFKQLTSPPEYLLLIDRHGLNDHRARLFEELYQAFKLNEVNVVRFFYHGDPRLCFNRRYPNGLNIKELQHRFGDARLFIIGNGYELLSPDSGKLSKWANIFTNWRERALFTPKPMANWDRRENYLAEHFYLMPASIESLAATLEEFGNLDPRSPQELIPRLEDVQWRAIEVEGDIISTLRKHYTERMVQWIAACAVYPQLQWDITLFLGREFSNDGDSLLTLENILKLTQLPWFIEGEIPNAAREELLDYLEKQGLEQHIRARLHWLFEHAPKPNSDSVAFDEYRINTAGNEWRFTKNRSRRRELEEELTNYYAAGHELDTVVFKYLTRERSRLDFEAPESWKKRLFNRGDAFFGLKDWVWALPLWVLLTMTVLFFDPKYQLCQGEKIQYQDIQLCLGQATDYLLYYEYLIRDEIADQNLNKADSLLNYARRYYFTESVVDSLANSNSTVIGTMKQVAVDTVTFLHNLSVYYYNVGVGFYNTWQHFQDSIRIELEREETIPQQQESNNIGISPTLLKYQQWNRISDSLAAKSCVNFQRGNQLFTNAKQGVSYDFILAMQKTCTEGPPTAPIEESFQGQVLENDSRRPIANVTVKALNGNITTKTGKSGSYTLTLPIELLDSTIRIEFSAEGYASRTENLQMQDPLPPIGLERLQPKSESLEIFTSKNGLKGLQTSSGRIILPARYNNIELDPASGLYRVQVLSKLDLRMGYVNAQGKQVIPVEYRVLGFLRDGRILAAKERYGYLDRNGNIAISFIYEGASDFSKGEAEVIQLLEGQRFTFVIDKDGRCIRSCPPESAYIKQKSVEQVKISENIEPITLYFDADAPDANNQATTTDDNYSRLFADLFSKKEQYVSSDATQQAPVLDRRRIDDFFSREVQDNYNRFNEALETTLNYLRNTKGQVEITLRGHASTDGSSAYSRILSARRISAVKNSLLNYNKGELRPYLESGRLKITEEALGDSQINSKTKGDLNIGKNLRSLNALLQQKVEVIIRFAN